MVSKKSLWFLRKGLSVKSFIYVPLNLSIGLNKHIRSHTLDHIAYARIA